MPLHRQFYCPTCRCESTFWKRTLKHRTHAWLTAATLGLWGFVWLGKAIRHWRKPWRCRTCARTRGPSHGRFRQRFEPILEPLFEPLVEMPSMGRRDVSAHVPAPRQEKPAPGAPAVEAAAIPSAITPE